MNTTEIDRALSMQAGLPEILDLPAEQYHDDTSAWSRSMIADFLERRSTCYAIHIAKTAPPQKASKVMDLGTLAHAALLEPHKLDTDFRIYPEELLASNGAVSTKAAKEFRDEHQAAGRVVLKHEDFDIVAKMVKSVILKVGKWLECADFVEQSFYWTDADTGLRFRCRPDLVITGGPTTICLDLKSTGDVAPWNFRRRIKQGRLWLQDGHYSQGLRSHFGAEIEFLFVAVESEWPFDCAIYKLDEQTRTAGYYQWLSTTHKIAECLDTGIWSDDWLKDINSVSLRDFELNP